MTGTVIPVESNDTTHWQTVIRLFYRVRVRVGIGLQGGVAGQEKLLRLLEALAARQALTQRAHDRFGWDAAFSCGTMLEISDLGCFRAEHPI